VEEVPEVQQENLDQRSGFTSPYSANSNSQWYLGMFSCNRQLCFCFREHQEMMDHLVAQERE